MRPDDDLITQCAARGWVAAEASVDVTGVEWVHVERALQSSADYTPRAGTTRAERARQVAARKIAIDLLTRWGHSAEDIAHRLNTSERTIHRYRARHVIGRPDPTIGWLCGWERPGTPRVAVQAGQLRSAS